MHAHHTIRRLAPWLGALLLIGVLGTACSRQPDAGDLRTIEVSMVDIGFEPTSISVSDGETVRLRFTNDGQLPHDAFIGDEAAQVRHGEEMAEMAEDADGGHGGHGGHGPEASQAVTVEPGETAELVHTFFTGDAVRIGCHQPGHYAAGMVLDVTVT